MNGQTVFMSFLSKYENNFDALNKLCRACLGKADKDVSVYTVLPWSKEESFSAQQLIEQMLNREVHSINSLYF